MITTIFVIGAGYVRSVQCGLISPAKLANQVTLVDIDAQKIVHYNSKRRRLTMRWLVQFLATQSLEFSSAVGGGGFFNRRFAIIATPTNYDVATGKSDTSSVETSIQTVRAHNAQNWTNRLCWWI